jgi:hypothetical protein
VDSTRDAAARPSLGSRVALFIGSLVFFGLAAEFGLRLVLENPFRGESPDQIVTLAIHHARRNLPMDRSLVDPVDPVVHLRTDARSYLLPVGRFEQPDATVLFLGGSTTECAALDDEDRFPARVSTLLGERGLLVNTLNAGKSGNTAHDSVNVFLNHAAQESPDVVVMMHAANDAGVLRESGSYVSRSGEYVSSRTALRWLLQEASTRSAVLGAVRYWRTVRPPGSPHAAGDTRQRPREVPTAPFEQRLRAFVGVVRAFGAHPVLMTQPLLARQKTELTPEWTATDLQALFNEAVRRVAREEGVVLIDLVRHVEQSVADPSVLFYDGIHVTTEGSLTYAAHIADRLASDVLPGLKPRAGQSR